MSIFSVSSRCVPSRFATQMPQRSTLSVPSRLFSTYVQTRKEVNLERVIRAWSRTSADTDVFLRQIQSMEPYYRDASGKPLFYQVINACIDNPKAKELMEFFHKKGYGYFTSEDSDGNTPLHLVSVWASRKLERPLVQLEIAHYLIPTLHRSNKKGEQSLHLASAKFNALLVALYIEHKADVNARDKLQRTPLMHLAKEYAMTNGSVSLIEDIAKQLIVAGADVDAVDKDGNTALHLCRNDCAARIMLQNGANPMIRNLSGETALESMEKHVVDINSYPSFYPPIIDVIKNHLSNKKENR